MDERFSRILSGLVQSERERRLNPTAQAIMRITDEFTKRNALGHGQLPVMRDRAAAEEYEFRALAWLEVARRAASEARLPWTSEMAADLAGWLELELNTDYGVLLQFLPNAPAFGQVAITRDLDTSRIQMRARLAHELELAVYAQDRNRVPLLDQLSAPRYAAVLESWRKSQGFLSSAPPDYSNASKEAVSAVEQLARILIDDPSATLRQAIVVLRAKGSVRAPLLKGVEEIWAWASATPSVRHGAATASESVDAATATYVAANAAAALGLFLSQDTA